MGSLKLVTAALANPVSLAEAKLFLRIDTSVEDMLVDNLITASTLTVERYTNRKLMTQTWDYFLDGFPSRSKSQWWDGTRDGKISEMFSVLSFISIPLYPLQSVTYLKTYDLDGTAVTMSASEHYVDTASEPSRLGLIANANWPTTFLRSINGVQIRAIAGYGSSINVPRPLKQAILDIAAGMYECRGEAEAQISKMAMALMAPYRVTRI